MKKFLRSAFSYLLPLMIVPYSGSAQSFLYGTTLAGGDEFGTIFKTDSVGNNHQVLNTFSPGNPGSSPFMGRLYDAGNNKLIGLHNQGGVFGEGFIYEYDYAADTYTNMLELRYNGLVNDFSFAPNGNLYGLESGVNSVTVSSIYEYNIATNTMTLKYVMDTIDGLKPHGKLVMTPSGKFIGNTTVGGAYNRGVIFEYDYITNVYTKKIDIDSTLGYAPSTDLMEAPSGKYYCTTSGGGANNTGTIIEYDYSGNTCIKKIDLDSANGFSISGDLLYINNGKFYGISHFGGANNKGVIFEYDCINNSYTPKITLSDSLGFDAYTGLFQASNGKIYGLTPRGGLWNKGVIYEYDPVGNIYSVKYHFDIENGYSPFCNLMEAANGKLYATTSLGGDCNKGGLFEFDFSTGTFTGKKDFGSTNGSLPYGKMVQAPNGKLYGLTLGNDGIYNPNDTSAVLFELDWKSNTYTKKKYFVDSTGYATWGQLLLASNGKIYGVAHAGGHSGRGTLYEYNCFTDSFAVRFYFSTQLGCFPRDKLVEGNNGKIYGIVTDGGPYWYYGIGGIYEFDPSTSIYTYVKDFYGIGTPLGGLAQSSNGKLYGCLSGGAFNKGIIYEYDYVNHLYSKMVDIPGGIDGGSVANTTLFEAAPGILLGSCGDGGLYNKGLIYQYDIINNQYSKLIDFDSTNGSYGFYTLMKASNGHIYGMARGGGIHNSGVIFEYDYASNTLVKKLDFNGFNGRYPYSPLTEVKSCTSFNTITASGCNSYISSGGNQVWYTSGTHLDTIPNAAGCDSILYVTLSLSKTYNTINPVACISYTSPSGNETWATSGTYSDTLTNVAGCDSIITIHLTIGANSQTVSLSSCNSIISPSGNYIWTTSGTYKDTITNIYGCDSIITINLFINQSSTSQLNIHSCDSFASPSGNHIWTNSGSYTDTVSTFAGCDSVIFILLDIVTSTTNTISPSACDSYISPGGNQTWFTSGLYVDTIPNAAGCDSIIIINLTINPGGDSTIYPVACNSYTSPGGSQIWTSTGIYNDTILTSGGCDSIITVHLTVNHDQSNSINALACDSYISPSGNFTWTISGNYTDTIFTSSGCDSILNIYLIVGHNETDTLYPVSCGNYLSPGGKTYAISGIYSDTLPTSIGCDSIFIIYLTVKQNSAISINPFSCDSFVSPSGNYTWIITGTYVDTIPNSVGCDSIFNINLTVNTVDINVSNTAPVLISNATNAQYQWVDCNDNYTFIAGAVNQSFLAASNGSYAVIVTQNSCTDTSACNTVNNVSVYENDFNNKIEIFPNPAKDILNIHINEPSMVIITDLPGREIYQAKLLQNFEIDLSSFSAGTYLLHVKSRQLSCIKKIVVEK